MNGGRIELEQLDPADTPLGVHRFYCDRHRELHRVGSGIRNASAMGHLFTAAPARFATAYWSLLVRAAVRRQVA